jgi:hypothetical protein
MGMREKLSALDKFIVVVMFVIISAAGLFTLYVKKEYGSVAMTLPLLETMLNIKLNTETEAQTFEPQGGD